MRTPYFKSFIARYEGRRTNYRLGREVDALQTCPPSDHKHCRPIGCCNFSVDDKTGALVTADRPFVLRRGVCLHSRHRRILKQQLHERADHRTRLF